MPFNLTDVRQNKRPFKMSLNLLELLTWQIVQLLLDSFMNPL